ncbi:MAG: PDZ domain-containing protein, partial [Flavobacteriales bacterium]|nr:PDZ domain-containing protein [Flavobacteriales bacterium]
MKLLLKNLKRGLIATSLLAVLLVGSAFQGSYFEISKQLDIFTTLFQELNTYYVDEIEPGELVKTGIDSMLESLDPYTNYIPESKIEDFRFQTTGEYGGIGALIRKQGEYIVISEPYLGFPADEAGLKAGDILLEVGGKSVVGFNTEQTSEVLKGEAGSEVKIMVRRDWTDDTFTKT